MRRNKIIGLSTEITVLIKVTQKSVVKSNFMESCRNLIVQLPHIINIEHINNVRCLYKLILIKVISIAVIYKICAYKNLVKDGIKL
jgi:TATA-binding protein-associated factor Taf7